MTDDDTIKQFAIRLSGSDVIPGVHHLNVFGVISRISLDDPSVRSFTESGNRDTYQKPAKGLMRRVRKRLDQTRA